VREAEEAEEDEEGQGVVCPSLSAPWCTRVARQRSRTWSDTRVAHQGSRGAAVSLRSIVYSYGLGFRGVL